MEVFICLMAIVLLLLIFIIIANPLRLYLLEKFLDKINTDK